MSNNLLFKAEAENAEYADIKCNTMKVQEHDYYYLEGNGTNLPDATPTLITYDPASVVSNGTAVSFDGTGTFTVNEDAIYSVEVGIAMDPTGLIEETLRLTLDLNGTSVMQNFTQTNTLNNLLSLKANLVLSATDVLKTYAYQDSGGPLTLGVVAPNANHIMIRKVN